MLTKNEVAKLFKCGKAKVQRWIDDGDLEAVDISHPEASRRQLRITQEAVERFKARRSTLAGQKDELPAVEEFV